jgi:acyl-CoA-dependent ceramide synthase
MNLTYIGNAVFMSMDIPDVLLAVSKLLNYMKWEKAKVVTFGMLVVTWSYFRHWLNFRLLWSVLSEFKYIPIEAQQWHPSEGIWLVWWMRWQMLFGLGALQLLNLFWYFLILRILVRTVLTKETTDERSDDEDPQSEEEKED